MTGQRCDEDELLARSSDYPQIAHVANTRTTRSPRLIRRLPTALGLPLLLQLQLLMISCSLFCFAVCCRSSFLLVAFRTLRPQRLSGTTHTAANSKSAKERET